MYDADAIEAINFEQLVTATDRLLLRGGRPSRRRPGIPPIAPAARGSQPQVDKPAVVWPRRSEPTLMVRRPRYMQMFAFTVAIPALLGIAVGLATLL